MREKYISTDRNLYTFIHIKLSVALLKGEKGSSLKGVRSKFILIFSGREEINRFRFCFQNYQISTHGKEWSKYSKKVHYFICSWGKSYLCFFPLLEKICYNNISVGGTKGDLYTIAYFSNVSSHLTPNEEKQIIFLHR